MSEPTVPETATELTEDDLDDLAEGDEIIVAKNQIDWEVDGPYTISSIQEWGHIAPKINVESGTTFDPSDVGKERGDNRTRMYLLEDDEDDDEATDDSEERSGEEVCDGGFDADAVGVGAVLDVGDHGVWEVIGERGPDEGLPARSIQIKAICAPDAERGDAQWLEVESEILPALERVLKEGTLSGVDRDDIEEGDYGHATKPSPGRTVAVCDAPTADKSVSITAHEDWTEFHVWDGDQVESVDVAELVDRVHAADLETLAERISATSAARGVDTYAVEDRGQSAADWGDMTGRDRSTVARNIRRAQDG